MRIDGWIEGQMEGRKEVQMGDRWREGRTDG